MSRQSTPVNEAEFIILDLETTGLEPEWGHRVCEVGFIVTRGSEEIQRFSQLVDPERDIEPSAALVNNLTSDMVTGAPHMTDILPTLTEALSGRVLIAYNASFDVGFLRSEYRLADVPLPKFRTIDLMAMAKHLLPELGRYPLRRVVEALGITTHGEHRALADAEAAAEVFQVFVEKLSMAGIVTIEQCEEMTRPTSPLSEALRRDKLSVLRQALEEGKRVHLIYRALDNAFTERDVTPLEIRTLTGKPQLQGYCHLRNAERTFNIDAIQDVEIVTAP